MAFFVHLTCDSNLRDSDWLVNQKSCGLAEFICMYESDRQWGAVC